tara:strand:+ start:286 stop:528 length:243 start_codon:yes stop_codon:yes gene_type:complete
LKIPKIDFLKASPSPFCQKQKRFFNVSGFYYRISATTGTWTFPKKSISQLINEVIIVNYFELSRRVKNGDLFMPFEMLNK